MIHRKDSMRFFGPQIQHDMAPSYMVLYLFKGTRKRLGVGHIALWDGTRYYSYGLGDGSVWIEDSFNFADAKARAIFDHKDYGPYKQIILPCNHYFSQNYETIQSTINAHWKSNEYSMGNKNCAHMVQDYLVQAKYTIPIPSCFLFPLYPSEVANNAKNLGQALVKTLINEIMSHPMEETYSDFLTLLRDTIHFSTALNTLQKNELTDILNASISDKKKFCNALAMIARHHYDHSLYTYKINECDEFYANMFIAALSAHHHGLKFENEAQIYKTGCLRYPIAVSRALLGALVGTVLAIILFIPAGMFYLYKYYVEKRQSASQNRLGLFSTSSNAENQPHCPCANENPILPSNV